MSPKSTPRKPTSWPTDLTNQRFSMTKNTAKARRNSKMKVWFLIVAVLLVFVGAKPAPAPQNQFLKNLGTTKILAGLGIKGAGYLTNNSGLKNLGRQVFGAGLGTKVAAHFFGGK